MPGFPVHHHLPKLTHPSLQISLAPTLEKDPEQQQQKIPTEVQSESLFTLQKDSLLDKEIP